MGVKLISITPEAEKLIAYCARVSNPKNQENYDTAPKLLAYLIKHKHWSPYEMSNMVLEITTGRDIAAQILRHRSFSFQEYSQRYSEAQSYVEREARRQDVKNKQNSIDDLSEDTKEWFRLQQIHLWEECYYSYQQALERGIAKECARSLLPLNTETTLYMNGSIRSWIHYIQLRTEASTQLEHREIALECQRIFKEQLPNTAEALGW